MMALHWATAACVLAAYLLSVGGHRVRIDPPLLHFSFGLAALALVLPRLIGRALGLAPPADAQIPPWLALAARLGHALLYALLIAVPLSGWYAASRLGVRVGLFGLTLPPLAATAGDSAGLIGSLHQLGGNAILILAGAHAAMGLWHHFWRRDQVLRRMVPF